MDEALFTGTPPPPDVRIVLVGRTGVGKSATGNTILGEDVFHSASGLSSVTSECQRRTVLIEGNRVSVVDTPGFFQTQKGLSSEIERCISLSDPGPHAFLYVLSLDTFTKQETDVVNVFEKCFGEEALQYTVFVFTHGDELNQTTIEELVENNATLSDLIQKSGWRFHVLNNKDRGNRKQVTELLEKILIMMNVNEGGYYSVDMLHEAQRKAEMMERLREEETRREEERGYQTLLENVRREEEETTRRQVEEEVRQRSEVTARGERMKKTTEEVEEARENQEKKSHNWAVFLAILQIKKRPDFLLIACVAVAVGGVSACSEAPVSFQGFMKGSLMGFLAELVGAVSYTLLDKATKSKQIKRYTGKAVGKPIGLIGAALGGAVTGALICPGRRVGVVLGGVSGMLGALVMVMMLRKDCNKNQDF